MSASRGPYQVGIRRRREILDAATDVFGQHGYSAGSLQQIAAQVGLSRAALSRHFARKEDLLVAVLDRWEEETGGIAEPLRGINFFHSFDRVMTFNAFHRGYIELFMTLAIEASDPSHPAHSYMIKRYERAYDVFLAELRAARDSGDVRAMSDRDLQAEVQGLMAVMDGLQIQWLLDSSKDLVGMFEPHLRWTIERWSGNAHD